jgi:mono/diheme cytochrome c family protein
MKSIYVKIAIIVLIVGVLAACGTQPEAIPVSGPTMTADDSAPTDAPLPTDTSPPTETEAPAATEPAVSGATVSFANDVLPIIESRCINCHGGERTQEGLDLKTHTSLMAGSKNGSIVTPGDAENSLLVELVATQEMPKRGPKLTPPQVQLITDWVNQGALNN